MFQATLRSLIPENLLFLLCISFLLLFALSETAEAHRAIVFAWIEGDIIHTQSKFSGGRKVKNGKIIVLDTNGKQLLTGQTNARGEFSFKIPGNETLKIVLEAGTGHRAEWQLHREDIETASLSDSSRNRLDKPAAAAPSTGIPSPAPNGLTAEDIETALERALDKKLQPVLKALAESRQDITLKDVLGGLGYIFGLVGVGTYFNYRQKRH